MGYGGYDTPDQATDNRTVSKYGYHEYHGEHPTPDQAGINPSQGPICEQRHTKHGLKPIDLRQIHGKTIHQSAKSTRRITGHDVFNQEFIAHDAPIHLIVLIVVGNLWDDGRGGTAPLQISRIPVLKVIISNEFL
jgi:hypothetical protein